MSWFELAALIGLLLAGVVVMLTALDARRDARADAAKANGNGKTSSLPGTESAADTSAIAK